MLLPAALSAQEGVLRFEHVAVEDGLSHGTVRAILQDELGFLWFGTQEGLNRYDGYDIKVYRHDPDDPGSLAESEAFALLEDRQGDLWVGTLGGGLDRFDRAADRFVHHRHDASDPASLSDDAVTSLLEDESGALWVGTGDGVNRLDRRTGAFRRYLPPPHERRGERPLYVLALLEDRSGELWAGAEDGLYRVDRGSESVEAYRHPDLGSSGWTGVQALLEDPEGRLWIGTWNGLKMLDTERRRLVHYRHDPADRGSLGDDTVMSLHLDRAGGLWVGTEIAGLDRLDRQSGVFRHSSHDPFDSQSLSDNSILTIYEDRTGILWLGGYVGVNKYDRRRERFVIYRQRPGRDQTLTGKSVWALYEDRSGELWVGTYDSGLNRLDASRDLVTNYPAAPEDPGGLPHGTVSALYEDRSGILWVGTWGGLAERIPGGGGRFVTYRHDPSDPESLGENTVYAIHEDRGGRLWVGTYGGLNRLERTAGDGARFVRYPAAPGQPELLGQTPIYVIYEDRAGSLWFGSDRDGLFRHDPESGRFRNFRHDRARRDSLSSDKVAALHEDRSGTLWIGTYGAGLNRLDALRQRFRHYREKDGLPSDTVVGILEDDGGRLWLATSHGLSRFDPATESCRNFDVADGLQGDVFSSRSAFHSPSGEMFFGGLQGFNAFFPDRIEDDPQAPSVVITDFLLFNRPVPLASADPDSPLERSIMATSELVLTHRDYVLSLEFAALHYGSPRKNRYAYRLEGFDRDWVATDSSQRFAHYSNLRPGDYVFRVRAANGDGVWNDEGAELAIAVLPPPWKTWWAYSLYVLALAAAVAGYLRSHHRKVERERFVNRRLRDADRLKGELIAELKAKNDELERFTYTVSHDLKSPLVTIQGFLGFLEKDFDAGKLGSAKKDIARIRTATRQMQQLLQELLELSRAGRQIKSAESAPLDRLVREALSRVAGQIAERGVEVKVAPHLPGVFGDQQRILQVLQNLIDNAVKYMGDQAAPRIEVGMRREGGDEYFFVRDNGMGIEPEHHDRVFALFERLDEQSEGSGLGLALVKRIVEVHGGRIWVESTGRGQGSTFCFTLPCVPGTGGEAT